MRTQHVNKPELLDFCMWLDHDLGWIPGVIFIAFLDLFCCNNFRDSCSVSSLLVLVLNKCYF